MQVEASIQDDERTAAITNTTAKLTIDQKANLVDDKIHTIQKNADIIHELDEKCDQIHKSNDKGDQEPDLEPNPNECDQVDTSEEKGDQLPDLDKNSQKYRLAMIEKALSDVRSMRSYASASTIAPDVVKQQVKKNLVSVQKKMERKKAVAKGEASAVTRDRRDNRETIRESHGLWGWDE